MWCYQGGEKSPETFWKIGAGCGAIVLSWCKISGAGAKSLVLVKSGCTLQPDDSLSTTFEIKSNPTQIFSIRVMRFDLNYFIHVNN